MNIDLSINPEETTKIIKDFIKTYVENAHAHGIVLGLSGGIDSAVTAVLCQQALGTKKIHCLFMPDQTTPQLDQDHKELTQQQYKLNCTDIDITPIVKNFSKYCLIKQDKKSLANIKTRLRMILLYDYAFNKKYIVSGTSNKSELLIGYFTKYGDGGADLQPIGDVYKTQIYELAKFLKIPKQLLLKKPTAGLWHGQTDEEELGITYKTLDTILRGLETKMEPKLIHQITSLPLKDIERIRNIRIKSQHKRRLPLIPKIGIRTPGLDWRAPIEEG